MDLNEILKDKEKYPDTMTVKFGEVDMPLGSLRQSSASEREQLQAAIKQNQDREKEISARELRAVKLSGDAEQTYERLKALEESAKHPAAPSADIWSDPFLAALKPEFEKRDQTVAGMQAENKKLVAALTQALAINMDERWDSQYNSIQFGKAAKKPTREELLKFAQENNILDKHKLPSVSRAWEEMSKTERLAQSTEEARQQGIEEGRRLQMASRVMPPGVPGAGPLPSGNGKLNPGELPDLLTESQKDPHLRALIDSIEGNVF